MTDVDTRARRAGAAARTEARVRARRLTRPGAASHRSSPAGRALLAVASGLVAVLLVVVVVGRFDIPAIPVIGPVTPTPAEVMQPMAEDGVLPVPEVGEVIAAYLEDGRPVFVTHPTAGDVLVLDAMSPHTHGVNELMVFCPSSGWFEDYYHGSRFNPWGDWEGGPAPTALPAYPTELSPDGDSIRVTGQAEEGRDRTDQRGDGQPQQGPTCVFDGDAPADAVVHRPPEPAPAMDGDEVPADRWVWATLVLGGTDDAPLVCSTDGTCGDDAPPVAGARTDGTGALFERAPAVYLARRDPSDGVQLIRPADPDDHEVPPSEPIIEDGVTRPDPSQPDESPDDCMAARQAANEADRKGVLRDGEVRRLRDEARLACDPPPKHASPPPPARCSDAPALISLSAAHEVADEVVLFAACPTAERQEGTVTGPYFALSRGVARTETSPAELVALYAEGLTREEADEGYTLTRPEIDEDAITVTQSEGTVTVSFTSQALGNNVSATYASTALLEEFGALFLQLPQIETVRFALDGSCANFARAVQRSGACVEIARRQVGAP